MIWSIFVYVRLIFWPKKQIGSIYNLAFLALIRRGEGYGAVVFLCCQPFILRLAMFFFGESKHLLQLPKIRIRDNNLVCLNTLH
jgi:hypothetical protein